MPLPWNFPTAPRRVLPSCLLGMAVAALPVWAQKVVVQLPDPTNNNYQAGTRPDLPPERKAPGPHRELFQFHARLEGELPQPDHWEWSVVDLDGKSVLPDAGTITVQGGLYTPPAVSLSRFRMVKIRAEDPRDRSRAGTAVIVIRPHAGLVPLESSLGKGWRGPRLELLHGAFFQRVRDLAYAPAIPWKGEPGLKDQWLVLDQGPGHVDPTASSLHCVSMTGETRTLAEFPKQVAGARADFVRFALKPWNGPGDGAWECFLWDDAGKCIWRLGADGDLARYSGPSVRPPLGQDLEDGSKDTARYGGVFAMVADRQGNLFLSESGTGFSCLRRVASDGSVRTLAMSTSSAPRTTGQGIVGLFTTLVLDETTQTLYGDHWAGNGSIYAYDLKTNTCSLLFKAPSRTVLVGLHQGKLVLEDVHGLMSAYDPRTGHSTPLFRDARHRRTIPGPSLGAVAGLAPKHCGSAGRKAGHYRIGGDGQVCVVCDGRELALVLPDWGLPDLAPAAGPGAKPTETKAHEERKR